MVNYSITSDTNSMSSSNFPILKLSKQPRDSASTSSPTGEGVAGSMVAAEVGSGVSTSRGGSVDDVVVRWGAQGWALGQNERGQST